MGDLRDILGLLDDGGAIDFDRLDAWVEATERLLDAGGSGRRGGEGQLLGRLAQAWSWRDAPGRPLQELPWLRHLGSEAHRVLLDGAPVETALVAVAAREIRLHELAGLDDGELADALIESTEAAIAMLEALRDPDEVLGGRIASLFPELAALAVAQSGAAVEHEAPPGEVTPRPLLDHLSLRVLQRKLRGLERGAIGLFERQPTLSPAGFADEAARLARVASAGVLPCVRAALLHLDFAKGGSPAQRQRWSASLGVDLSVHNAAAAQLLERGGGLGRFTLLRRPALAQLVIALVESHGLAGQSVRGETPLAAFAPFVAYLRGPVEALASALGGRRADAAALAIDCLHLIDVCDTAGVREGLLDDALRRQLWEVSERLAAAAGPAGPIAREAIEQELADVEAAAWRERAQNPSGFSDSAGGEAGSAQTSSGISDNMREEEARGARLRLADRLARLRQGRQRAGEPRGEVEAAVAAVGDAAVRRLSSLLAPCQLWYAEAATGQLSAAAQLKVLALAARAAERRSAVEVTRPYHVTLQPLVGKLHGAGGDATVRYRLRLVETMLESRSVDAILSGDSDKRSAVLGAFTTAIGGSAALAIDFEASAEAQALLTLLAIYEQKSTAAFHATLKALCDLYGLRKDEFDRVANEASYLVTMNAARSDKARMLDHVRPGRIVEVGPGGGVVLDLLEERFPASEVIGIDVSRMVIEALQQKRRREGRRWSLVEADAFALPDHVGKESVDSVLFCSVLHEIYSYVERPGDGGAPPRRFRLESVRDLLRAAYAAIVPGGRIVIRDGVCPEPGSRILRFIADDSRAMFDLFVAQFEGRRIAFEELDPARVRLSAPDAMEFLYTYTWGPESFPYEVREQYGVLPYREYRSRVLEWLGDPAWRNTAGIRHLPRALDLPAAEASYLQPGYRTGLAGKVELTDGDGAPVELPDSNCLLVFEKAL